MARLHLSSLLCYLLLYIAHSSLIFHGGRWRCSWKNSQILDTAKLVPIDVRETELLCWTMTFHLQMCFNLRRHVHFVNVGIAGEVVSCVETHTCSIQFSGTTGNKFQRTKEKSSTEKTQVHISSLLGLRRSVGTSPLPFLLDWWLLLISVGWLYHYYSDVKRCIIIQRRLEKAQTTPVMLCPFVQYILKNRPLI